MRPRSGDERAPILALAREGGGGRVVLTLALERGGEEVEDDREGREGVEEEMVVGDGFLFLEKKETLPTSDCPEVV